MPKSGGNRIPYLVAGTGILFIWAGLNNKSVLQTMGDLIKGQKPTPGAVTIPGAAIAGSGSPDPNIDNPTDHAGIVGLAMAMNHGKFGDAQWDSLNKLVMGESGWNPTAKNPSSGAFGIAQALGHGTGGTNGTMSNEYGGFGLSETEARQANSGQAGPQIKWLLNYISTTYGNPNNAYMKWLSRNPHWY